MSKSNSISEEFPLYHSNIIPIYHTERIMHKGKRIIESNTYTNEHPDFLKLDCMKEKGYKNPYLNDQFIYQYNNENIQNENPIIYQTQTFNNKNYYNSINNIYLENNITSELTKTTEIQKENSDNPNIKLIPNTTLITNPQSPFYEKNGEIISNSNYERYFRQTSTAPVTSYGYCQNQSQRNYMEDEGKVIENLNYEQISELLYKKISPNFRSFCFNQHGTRVVQILINTIIMDMYVIKNGKFWQVLSRNCQNFLFLNGKIIYKAKLFFFLLY